jgi:tetraacyldisaccharide 4'-kinase
MLKTPKFWTEKNIISYALLPLSWLYFCGFFLVQFFTKTQKISKKVICVGNLIAGGSGKTPSAIAIGKIFNEAGIDFAFLSRGYMGDGSKFLLLRKEDKNKAEVVGDEPMLLVETAPTFVATNRLFGAKQIDVMKQFKVVILDDGMQNNSLHRDFIIMVVDGKIGFGNDFLIPAGPMRETLHQGLKKADLIILIGDAKPELEKKLIGKKIAKAKIFPTNLEKFKDKKLLAFCGLAYPQKFFSFLSSKGLEVVTSKDFADHHSYQEAELKNLISIAQEKNLTLITTKKDWIKFPKVFQDKISYLDIELEFENKAMVMNELRNFL